MVAGCGTDIGWTTRRIGVGEHRSDAIEKNREGNQLEREGDTGIGAGFHGSVTSPSFVHQDCQPRPNSSSSRQYSGRKMGEKSS